MADKKVGKVAHYYDKIGVAILELTTGLKVGDKIKFVKGDNEFEQEVKSIQIDHKQVKKAKKGDDVGVKVDQEVEGKTEVYKVSS